jgi:hypothetical protein
VTERRQELDRTNTEAAEAGDTDAIMAAEHELSLLPKLESHLQAQVDIADAQATELNAEVAEVESRADRARAEAIALRGRAAADPPLPELEHKARERTQLDADARRQAREAALRAVRAMPDPADLDAAAALFAREVDAHQTARAEALRAEDVALLAQVARIVEQVRDAAEAEAQRRIHAPMGVHFRAPIAGVERQELKTAVESYRARVGRELPRCEELATDAGFGLVDGRLRPDRFAADLSDVATDALGELDAERSALDATR